MMAIFTPQKLILNLCVSVFFGWIGGKALLKVLRKNSPEFKGIAAIVITIESYLT